MIELCEMWSTPSLPLFPGPLAVAPYDNETVLTFKMRAILNWIVWNGTDFDIKTVLTLIWIV